MVSVRIYFVISMVSIIELYNDGDNRVASYVEKGGLKNIRSMVENNGGKMTIDTSDSFKLIIELGVNNEV